MYIFHPWSVWGDIQWTFIITAILLLLLLIIISIIIVIISSISISISIIIIIIIIIFAGWKREPIKHPGSCSGVSGRVFSTNPIIYMVHPSGWKRQKKVRSQVFLLFLLLWRKFRKMLLHLIEIHNIYVTCSTHTNLYTSWWIQLIWKIIII